jgi:orotate phosphoribosyltransferase
MNPTKSNTSEDVARMIFATGAYCINTEKPFFYTSGKIGIDYIDMSKIQNAPKMWDKITDYLVSAIVAVRAEAKLKIDKITGGETRDLIFSIPVANKLGLPHAIIRKEEKTYGIIGKFAGQVNEGEHVLHVSDLMNVGSSSAKMWVPAIRESGAIIEYYLTVFDRLQGGKEALRKLNPPIKLISLCQRDKKFYDAGEKFGFIKNRAELDRFNKDPDDWGRTFVRKKPETIIEHIKVVNRHIDQREKGLKVLLEGYPELIPELGSTVAKTLRDKNVVDAVPELGYKIKPVLQKTR